MWLAQRSAWRKPLLLFDLHAAGVVSMLSRMIPMRTSST